ncbi:hypothetical protein AMS59_19585 [Lysinibacillus sp. FJAT-14745]|uniref:hypothetical protein n=1 Tax=Lysinibacillus sp. FJAT-14745 TaxID=1704289 RepID=UPI0006ABAA2D|nr:hypothetical protein [Lysinibacillus sp. FJAT-14745]KOP70731.1 hypothetical protein AMS59_19585 [Lysinibacillus sp. FJAT-14745]
MTTFTPLQEAQAFAEAFLLSTEQVSLNHPYKKDKGRYPRVRKFLQNHLLNGTSDASTYQQGVGQLMMFCAQFAQQKALADERDAVYKELVKTVIPKLLERTYNFSTINPLAGFIYLGVAMLKNLDESQSDVSLSNVDELLVRYRDYFANEVLSSKEYHALMYHRTPSAWTYNDSEKAYRFATGPYSGQIGYWITTADLSTDPQKNYLEMPTVLDSSGQVTFAGIQPGTSGRDYIDHHSFFNTKNERFILNASLNAIALWMAAHVYDVKVNETGASLNPAYNMKNAIRDVLSYTHWGSNTSVANTSKGCFQQEPFNNSLTAKRVLPVHGFTEVTLANSMLRSRFDSPAYNTFAITFLQIFASLIENPTASSWYKLVPNVASDSGVMVTQMINTYQAIFTNYSTIKNTLINKLFSQAKYWGMYIPENAMLGSSELIKNPWQIPNKGEGINQAMVGLFNVYPGFTGQRFASSNNKIGEAIKLQLAVGQALHGQSSFPSHGRSGLWDLARLDILADASNTDGTVSSATDLTTTDKETPNCAGARRTFYALAMALAVDGHNGLDSN